MTKYKTRLREARDKLAKKVDALARKRLIHYKNFMMKLLTKEGKKKKGEAEQIADDLLDEVSYFLFLLK